MTRHREELITLIDEIKPYINHRSGCAILSYDRGTGEWNPCDCGLAKVCLKLDGPK